MRQIALSILFVLAMILSLGCKSMPETANASNGEDGLCTTGGFRLCEYVDSYHRVTVGQQRCLQDGMTVSGCEPIDLPNLDDNHCSYGALYACFCDDGNVGQKTCIYGGGGAEFSECVCSTQQGAGGGTNTTTTTSTTTETNSGTGGGDAGQGGQGGQGNEPSCDKPVQFQIDPDTTPNNMFLVESGWNVAMNRFIVVNPCDTDQQIRQLTEFREDWNGVVEDFVDPVAYFLDEPNPEFYAGEFALDGSVTFYDIVVPANSARRLVVVMYIPETKPLNESGAAHSGDSGKFVPKMAWSGDDWKPIAINGDYNPTKVIIHASIPQVQHQWYNNPTKLHNGVNQLIAIDIATNPGREVDIRQLVFKVDHSPELTLDATVLENQGFSPIYVNGGSMVIEPGTQVFYPGWGRAVYMNKTDGELAVSDVWQNHLTISLNLVVSGVTPQSWVQVKLDDGFTGDVVPRRLQIISYDDPGVWTGFDFPQQAGPPHTSAFLWTDKSEKGNHKTNEKTSPDYYGMSGIGNAYNTALTSAQ